MSTSTPKHILKGLASLFESNLSFINEKKPWVKHYDVEQYYYKI